MASLSRVAFKQLSLDAQPREALRVSDRVKMLLVLCVALLQGLLYLFLLPPWQHYDEPTHFEYAWLIAHRGRLPHVGEVDQSMRREVAVSMLQHKFYWNLGRPNLITDDGEIWIGFSELQHPPAYYVLVSIPLFLVRHLDVTSQLYVVRFVSLVLFLMTIMVAGGVMRELTPSGHPLRWVVPLTLVLLGPLVDVMTAVNNDAGAVFVVSLFLWGAVRAIRYGWNWTRLVWVLGTPLLAVLTKNTASPALVLVPFVFLIRLWVQNGWYWRRFALGAGAILVIFAVVVLDWGDAAYWYRPEYGSVQDSATRISDPSAPLGSHAIVLDNVGVGANQYVISPILTEDLERIAGQTVTVGGWVWANQPATVGGPGLLLRRWGGGLELERVLHPVTVGTTPTLVAWTFTVPTNLRALHYALFGSAVEHHERPLRIMLNGAFLVMGEHSASVPPVFDDASGRAGTWNDQRFMNLVRNPSATAAWPRFRPWFDHIIVRYIHRSPAPLLAALLDLKRTWPFIFQIVSVQMVSGIFTGFAWGQIKLSDVGWSLVFYVLTLGAIGGCIRWLVRSASRPITAIRPALLFLGISGVLVWGNTVARPLPILEAIIVPVARYAFPVAIPTALVLAGGWWSLWPKRYRAYGAFVFLLCLAGLNVVSVWTIWSFYRALSLA